MQHSLKEYDTVQSPSEIGVGLNEPCDEASPLEAVAGNGNIKLVEILLEVRGVRKDSKQQPIRLISHALPGVSESARKGAKGI